VDAIQLIVSDHREVERLFKEFERAERAGDVARQADCVRSLVRELSVHASIEEQFVYPAVRQRAGDARVLDALEEHHGAKVTLDEIDALPLDHPRLASKVRLLAENVRRHVEEEERDLLPALERALGEDGRRDLGDVLARAKRTAPTRPHPFAPDTPPANFLASAVASIVDRSRDAIRSGGDLLRTLLALATRGALYGTRRLAMAAEGTLRSAAERGREAVDEARAKGREAADDARAAVDRVEVRTTQAAREARRSGRTAARAASAAGRAAAREVRGTRRSSRRSRRSRRNRR
jgi:hemerythrin superfamily protein